MTCKVGNVEGLIFNDHSNQRENLKMKKQSPSCMWFYNLGEGNMLRISKAFNLPWWWWYNLLGLMSSIPLNLTNGTTESFLLNYFSRYWGMMMQLVKNPPAKAGNSRKARLIPVWGGSSGVGNGNPLQYSCLENPMDRGARQTTVYGFAKNQTRLNMHT